MRMNYVNFYNVFDRSTNQELSKFQSGLPLTSSSRLISRHTFDAMLRTTSSLDPILRGIQGEVETLGGCCGGPELDERVEELLARLRRLQDSLEKEFLPLVTPPAEPIEIQDAQTTVPTSVTVEPDWSEKLLEEVQQANEWVKKKQLILDGMSYEREMEKIKKTHKNREDLEEEIQKFKNEVRRLVDAKVGYIYF